SVRRVHVRTRRPRHDLLLIRPPVSASHRRRYSISRRLAPPHAVRPCMNPIVFALRHPYTVMVAIVAVVLGAVLAVFRMPVDIFPDLNTPVIYVAQPYGGMDPQQMEGFLTNYYEYHFLYITGIDHV